MNVKEWLSKLKERVIKSFDGLSPEQKKAAVIAGLSVTVLAVGYLSYGMKKPPAAPRLDAAKTQTKSLGSNLHVDMLEKTEYAQSSRAIRELNDGLKSVRDELSDIKKEKELERRTPGHTDRLSYPPGIPPVPDAIDRQKTPAKSADPGQPAKLYPPPPAPAAPPVRADSSQAARKEPQTAVSQYSDGIAVFTNKQPDAAAKEDKKKQDVVEEVYLPPSFMAATLLSGLDAPTVEAGRKNPMLVLIRINDLAVLPNRVKADLKGCFFIAQGYGDLAAERAYLQIVTLSCLAKNGGAIIDQDVQGFVVDDDGKIGLQGTPVARFGKAMYAAAVSGVFKGVGDVLKSQSQITTVSTGGGVSQMFDKDQLSVAAVGGGLSGAFDKMYEFYIRLAEMSMPVIEVGANKELTVVIQKGLTLKIMSKPGGVKS